MPFMMPEQEIVQKTIAHVSSLHTEEELTVPSVTATAEESLLERDCRVDRRRLIGSRTCSATHTQLDISACVTQERDAMSRSIVAPIVKILSKPLPADLGTLL